MWMLYSLLLFCAAALIWVVWRMKKHVGRHKKETQMDSAAKPEHHV